MSSVEEETTTTTTTTTTTLTSPATTTQVVKNETPIAASPFANLTTSFTVSAPVVSDTIKTEEAEGDDNEVLYI